MIEKISGRISVVRRLTSANFSLASSHFATTVVIMDRFLARKSQRK